MTSAPPFIAARLAQALAVAVLVLVSVAVIPSPAMAQLKGKYAAITIDAQTGEVLHARNPDKQLFPASMTKMMTLYLMFEAVEDGRFGMRDRLPVSRYASRQECSCLNVQAGSTIRVEDAISALIVKSANDVAMVVAEALGGSERRFAQMMTKTARRLGMSRTVFKNPSGLPNNQQVSTARDMARLSQALMRDFPQFYSLFGQTRWRWRERGVTFRSHNRILSMVDGADGLKTGYIRASGFNLAASAKRGGLRLVTVVYGGNTSRWRDRRVADLMETAFDSRRGQLLIARGQDRDIALPPTAPGAPVHVADAVLTTLEAAVPIALASIPKPPTPPGHTRDDFIALAQARAQDQAPLSVPLALLPRGEPLSVRGASFDPDTQIAGLRPRDRFGPRVDQGSEGRPDASWGIQVGAFTTPEDSYRAMELALDQLPDLLGHAEPLINEIETAGGVALFRARLIGLEQKDAAVACAQLVDFGLGCLPVAPTGGF